MQRALELAAFGGSRVSPNPFVGAVIVADGRIIGEGYHRNYGGPHAEVNAVNSVRDSNLPLLKRATMYVTLEPCSHFGKTPPCSDLIIEKEIPHVILAAEDPFLKDHGSGIERMRNAGIAVETGLLKEQALFQNRRFFTAHTLKRPFMLLKWAQTADGYIGGADRLIISNAASQVLMHRERALYDAVMAGTDTVICDNPNLNSRLWPVREPENRPRPITFDSERLPKDANIFKRRPILKGRDESLSVFLHRLYADYGIVSLMVEGGGKTLQTFLDEGLFDEIRIETGMEALGSGPSSVAAPVWEDAAREKGLRATPPRYADGNLIEWYVKNY